MPHTEHMSVFGGPVHFRPPALFMSVQQDAPAHTSTIALRAALPEEQEAEGKLDHPVCWGGHGWWSPALPCGSGMFCWIMDVTVVQLARYFISSVYACRRVPSLHCHSSQSLISFFLFSFSFVLSFFLFLSFSLSLPLSFFPSTPAPHPAQSLTLAPSDSASDNNVTPLPPSPSISLLPCVPLVHPPRFPLAPLLSSVHLIHSKHY